VDTSVGAHWVNFMLAGAGAASALTGLLFVALSINLARILELPGVPGRAVEAIVLLAGALVGALLVLLPNESAWALGVMIIAVGAVTWGIPTWSQIRGYRRGEYYRRRYALQRLVFQQAATIPFLLAGLSLCGYLPGQLYWLAAALILAMLVAIIDAWVLLVEILR